MKLETLQAAPLARQREQGYADTLREILQQPATWAGTAGLLREPHVLEQWRAAAMPRPACTRATP